MPEPGCEPGQEQVTTLPDQIDPLFGRVPVQDMRPNATRAAEQVFTPRSRSGMEFAPGRVHDPFHDPQMPAFSG